MADKKPGRARSSPAFNAAERAAMKARAREMHDEQRGADGEAAVQAAIARMPEPDRTMSARLHEIIRAAAPGLAPKTWYGMPAYTNTDGKVVCFFRPASKFKDRYLTIGFNDSARLDDGAMWPTAFALTELKANEERRIRELVRKAVG